MRKKSLGQTNTLLKNVFLKIKILIKLIKFIYTSKIHLSKRISYLLTEEKI